MTEALLSVLTWPILERIPIFPESVPYVGGLAISPHGIGTAVGFLVGAMMLFRRAELRGLSHRYVPDIRIALQDLLFRGAVGAIIGARFFYVLAHLDRYLQDPLSMLYVWEGGLTFLGGVAGAMIAALPLGYSRGYRITQILDSAAPGLAVGIFIGRIGDLVIGDHLGDPAPGFPLAWRCDGNLWDSTTNTFAWPPLPPDAGPAFAGQTQGCFEVAVHQTALYDFIQAGLLLAVILYLERRPRWDGFFISVWLYWYGSARFVMDFLREDRRFFGLTGSQYTGLAVIVLLTAFLAWRKPWRDRPWAWDPPRFDHPWLTPPEDASAEDGSGDGAEPPDQERSSPSERSSP